MSSKQKKSNNGVKWTDIAMVIITGILAYFTFGLFKTATTQSEQTIKTTQSAHIQDSITELIYTRDNANNIAANERNRINDSINKQRDRIELDAQISQLKQNQKQFEIANKPYLVMVGLQVDTPKFNNPIRIIIGIGNFGKIPAVFISIKRKIEFSTSPTLTYFKYDTTETFPTNEYMPENKTVHFETTSKAIVDKELFQEVFIKKSKFIIIHGELTYLDVSINKKYVLKFCYRLTTTHRLGTYWITPNHNEVVKN